MAIFSYSHGYSRVLLDAPKNVHAWLQQHFSPFISPQEEFYPIVASTWKVVTDSHKLRDPQRYVSSPPGEPEAVFLVDWSDKVICPIWPEEQYWVQQNCLRIIRALLKIEAACNGEVFLHAGAMQVNNRWVLLLGPSRSGKTTLCAYSLLQGGNFVGNDDISIFASPNAHFLSARGWPRAISVRLDSWKMLNQNFYEVIESLRHPANGSLHRLVESGEEPHGTALLFPSEFAATFGGAKIQKAVAVDALVFLQFGETTQLSSVPEPNIRESLLRMVRAHGVIYERFLECLVSDFQASEDVINKLARLPAYDLQHIMGQSDIAYNLLKDVIRAPT